MNNLTDNHSRRLNLFPKLIVLMLTLLLVQNLKAGSFIELEAPDWSVQFNSLSRGHGSPKLSTSEYELIDNLKQSLHRAEYRIALKILNDAWPESPSAALFYIRAQLLTQLKNYHDAQADYLASIKAHGEYLLAAHALAGLALIQDKPLIARQRLVQTISLGGRSAELFGQLAYLNLQQGASFSAVSAYQYAYTLQPENIHWQQGLLLAFSETGAHDQATALANELLLTAPGNSELWLHKANAALQSENKLAAITAMEAAVRLGNQDRQNVILLANLHLQWGNIQRAIDLSSQYPQFLSEYSALKSILDWLARNKRWSHLRTLLETSRHFEVSYTAQDRSHYNTISAKLSLANKKTTSAKTKLNKAIELNPTNAEALLLLAEIYLAKDQLNQADLALSRAATDLIYREAAILKRAEIAYLQHRYNAALNLMQEVLKRNPSRADLIHNMDILQRLIRQEA